MFTYLGTANVRIRSFEDDEHGSCSRTPSPAAVFDFTRNITTPRLHRRASKIRRRRFGRSSASVDTFVRKPHRRHDRETSSERKNKRALRNFESHGRSFPARRIFVFEPRRASRQYRTCTTDVTREVRTLRRFSATRVIRVQSTFPIVPATWSVGPLNRADANFLVYLGRVCARFAIANKNYNRYRPASLNSLARRRRRRRVIPLFRV